MTMRLLTAAVLAGLATAGLSCTSDRAATQTQPAQQVSQDQFAQAVLGSPVPVVVDFFATWCGPCRELAPALDQLAREYQGRAKFVRVDVDQSPQLSREYKVEALPTVGFFKGGQEVRRLVGLHQAQDYRNVLNELLKQPSTEPGSSP